MATRVPIRASDRPDGPYPQPVTSTNDRGLRLQTWRRWAVALGARLLDKPMRALIPLLVVALMIELGQYRHELIPGGHAVGELVRNLTYALMGALVFHWLIVEIPERRRRRAAYEYNRLGFETLLTAGAALIAQYRHFQPPGEAEFDAWSQRSISARAKAIATHTPLYFGAQRADLLENVIYGVQVTLDGIKSAQIFFDPDVAHALALFPGTVGLRQLQVLRDPGGSISWQRDSHIVWELLEASRRLYPALRRSVPDISFNLGQSELTDGTVVHSRESDVLKPDQQS